MDKSTVFAYGLCIGLLLGQGAAGSPAIGQTPPVESVLGPEVQERAHKTAEELRTNAQQTCTDPSLDSGARCPPKVQAKLSATREDTKATLEVGWKHVSDQKASELLYGLTVAGPIGKSATGAELASFDGLANAVTATLGVHWLSSNPVRQFQLTSASWKKQKKNAGKSFDDHLIEKCAALAETPGECDSDDLLKLGEDGWRKFMTEALGLRGSWLVSFQAALGSEKFDFADPEMLADMSQTEESYKASVTAGRLPLGSHTYFVGGGYTYQETYKAKPKTEVCRPLGDEGALQCKSIALGAPEKKGESLANVELRRYFNTAGDTPWAINPKLTWNLDSEELGVALPFYFLTDTKGNLNGGISIEWRTDTEEFVVKAFFGGMSNVLGFREPDS